MLRTHPSRICHSGIDGQRPVLYLLRFEDVSFPQPLSEIKFPGSHILRSFIPLIHGRVQRSDTCSSMWWNGVRGTRLRNSSERQIFPYAKCPVSWLWGMFSSIEEDNPSWERPIAKAWQDEMDGIAIAFDFMVQRIEFLLDTTWYVPWNVGTTRKFWYCKANSLTAGLQREINTVRSFSIRLSHILEVKS